MFRTGLPVRSVGVTGTNGKTTTTTWIAAALSSLHRPVFLSTTLGYFAAEDPIAVSKGVEGFFEAVRVAEALGAKLAAVELTSQALWSGFARQWVSEVGVFTNLTRDHFDVHGDATFYLACKAQLFLTLQEGGTAVLNGCDATFPLLAEVVPRGCRVVSYGDAARGAAQTALDAEIGHVEVSWEGTRWTVMGPSGVCHPMRAGAIGAVFAENGTAALLAAMAMGVPREAAAAAIARTASPPGRFELVHERPYVVVDYAHTPDALERTCRTGRHLAAKAGGRVTVVFGAGGERDKGKRVLMGAAVRDADRVLVTTDNPRREDPRLIAESVLEGLAGHPSARIVLDRRSAIEAAIDEAGPDDVVLVCGRGHETEQTVHDGTTPFTDAAVVRSVLLR